MTEALKLNRFFRIEERGSSVGREIIGGATTFVTMAYIIFVNPAILGDVNGAGMNMGAVMVATVLASGLACIIMGIAADLPVALAPGMGMNALFSYTICARMGVRWETALGIVVISGAVFLALSLFRFREKIIGAVPESLKYGAAAGIGLFIAFIGLKNAGIVVPDTATFVSFGPIAEPPVLLSLLALAVTGVLTAFGIRGGILIGLAATGMVGMATGIIRPMAGFEPSLKETFLAADLKAALSLSMAVPILTFLFFDLFDTVGTLVGVAETAGLKKEDGGIPNAGRALAA
ncbi:MAG: NCS2 family permease, partial [Planctomycetes bacterium]|nr:NCS2 family permease [Planctomycetota bacterium]